MAQQTRAVNKARYENGDRPQGSDYADLIDSYVALADADAQSMASSLQSPKFITTELSAGVVNASAATIEGAVTAASVVAASATFTVSMSAVAVFASAATIVGPVT